MAKNDPIPMPPARAVSASTARRSSAVHPVPAAVISTQEGGTTALPLRRRTQKISMNVRVGKQVADAMTAFAEEEGYSKGDLVSLAMQILLELHGRPVPGLPSALPAFAPDITPAAPPASE